MAGRPFWYCQSRLEFVRGSSYANSSSNFLGTVCENIFAAVCSLQLSVISCTEFTVRPRASRTGTWRRPATADQPRYVASGYC
jgi:hypothetical protein